MLEEQLDPAGSEVSAHGRRIRTRDKVMQLRHDYERKVFNGDIGQVAAADPQSGNVSVNFDGRLVMYELADLGALAPAYAVSVHKAQGAEFAAVIIPLLTQHCALLQRNVLYTAVTRGKRLVVLLGSRKALAIALRNEKRRQRPSRLAEKLAKAAGSGAWRQRPEGADQRRAQAGGPGRGPWGRPWERPWGRPFREASRGLSIKAGLSVQGQAEVATRAIHARLRTDSGLSMRRSLSSARAMALRPPRSAALIKV